MLERVARVNGKLHVLALDFSGQEGDDHQLSPRSIEESAGACALALTNLMQTSGVRIHGFLVVGRRMRQGEDRGKEKSVRSILQDAFSLLVIDACEIEADRKWEMQAKAGMIVARVC